ncbi:hypothetical protein KGM_203068 [Danaus plexippus plexippus]|uniref:Uncharacterized protein n=1 Tax=Danaus plexippus plexippus TaxID=278856 RepID=A0A212EUK0_DANPL|nr:hypothetical protein KGM_203068 [Danaus plexippus plexippus]
MLKYYMKNGDSEKKIPILDPFEIENGGVEIVLPSKILSLQAGYRKAVVKGVSHFQLDRAKFIKEKVAVNLTITFPSIRIKSEYYKLEGDIYGAVPISGEGKFELEVISFNFKGMVFLKQSEDEKSVLINYISNPEFSFQQIQVFIIFQSNTDVDGNIDGIFNAMMEDLMTQYLNRFNKYIANSLNQYFIDNLNLLFNKFESWRLLATVL